VTKTAATKPISALAELTLAQAERALGKDAGPWALYLYACEAVWDLWRDARGMPVYVADGVLAEIRDELERRAATRAAAVPGALTAGERAA
jgi:hypothetical protein